MLKLEANPADVATLDSIITAVYDGISGPAGKKRDWDRERSLYIPGARLIPTAMKAGTENMDLAPHILDIEGFIARVEPFFEESGFYEKEKHVHALEMKIAALEGQQRELVTALEDPAAYQPSGRAVALNRELSAVTDDLARLTKEWETATAGD